jgi:deazaflavin-dependent oxidoreductase (nitroreductase family)
MFMGILLLGIGAVATVFVGGMRAKWPPVVDNVRRLQRAVFNPEQMKSAGTPGAFASVIRHTGRKTGTVHETPLGAVPTTDGFVIALFYGPRTEWLRNVLASGTATVVNEGVAYEVDRPEVVPVAEVADQFSASDRMAHWVFGVESCLRVRRVEPSEVAG